MKRHPLKKPILIKEILAKSTKNLGLTAKTDEQKIWKIWDSVVGKQIAIHTQPHEIKFKRLIVLVSNSVWMQQLNFLKQDIVDKLNKKFDKKIINNIHFIVGKIEKKPRNKKTSKEKKGDFWLESKINHLEMNQIEEHLKSISEPELKSIFKKIMIKGIIRNKKVIGKN